MTLCIDRGHTKDTTPGHDSPSLLPEAQPSSMTSSAAASAIGAEDETAAANTADPYITLVLIYHVNRSSTC